MKYALDTNIISYYLKGNIQLQDKVDSEAENHNIVIPPFVYFETKKWLLAVQSKSKLNAFEKLFKERSIDDIDKEVVDMALSIYVKLRKAGITVDDGDLFIAAYCIKNDAILVTNNVKHFEKIDNVHVVNWVSNNNQKTLV